jgi:hypothetical protein
MNLAEEYQEKAIQCLESIELLGSDRDAILDSYSDHYFNDSKLEKSLALGEVLSGRVSEPVAAYLNTKCDLTHHRDRRTAVEYAVDLVLGWIIEDALLDCLRRRGVVSSLAGQDRNREFLSPREISTQPDLVAQIGDERRLVEVFADWRNTWSQRGHADLRDNKFDSLIKGQALLFGIAPRSALGFLMVFPEASSSWEASYIPAYRKNGYSCRSIRDHLRPLDSVLDSLLDPDR